MRRHESSVVIDRPLEEVWTFLVDFFNAPRMGGGRLRVRVTSPGPVGLASSIQQRVVILGFETSIDTVVTEWDPPHAIAHSTSSTATTGPIRGTFRTSLERTPGGTKVVRMAEMEPRGILRRLLWPILWPLLVPRIDAQTRNLKRLLESSGPPRA